MAKIDPRFLKGIKMTGAEEKIVEKEGKKTRQNIPWERQATEDDVLKYEDLPDSVHIVIKNGRKYDVSKNREEKDEKKK